MASVYLIDLLIGSVDDLLMLLVHGVNLVAISFSSLEHVLLLSLPLLVLSDLHSQLLVTLHLGVLLELLDGSLLLDLTGISKRVRRMVSHWWRITCHSQGRSAGYQS